MGRHSKPDPPGDDPVPNDWSPRPRPDIDGQPSGRVHRRRLDPDHRTGTHRPVDPDHRTGTHRPVDPDRPTGTHRPVDPDQLTSTGSHRAIGAGDGGGRRIAAWPIAVLVIILVLGLGTVAVIWGNSTLNNPADAEDQRCSEGERTVEVAVAPQLEKAASTVADSWNTQDRAVRGHCITIDTTAADVTAAIDAIDTSDADADLPAAWIATSAAAQEKLADAVSDRVATTGEPLRTSSGDEHPYVVFGGTGLDDVDQRAVQEFRQYLDEPQQASVLRDAGIVSG